MGGSPEAGLSFFLVVAKFSLLNVTFPTSPTNQEQELCGRTSALPLHATNLHVATLAVSCKFQLSSPPFSLGAKLFLSCLAAELHFSTLTHWLTGKY